MNQTEYKIHCAIVEHLESAWPQIEFTHAGKARDETHAHFLSRMGYKAGTADLIWFCAGKFGEGEVKQLGGVQSSAQKTRQAALERNGGYYIIWHSVRESHDYFLSLGFKPMHNAVQEPDLRTEDERKADAFNFYKPSF